MFSLITFFYKLLVKKKDKWNRFSPTSQIFSNGDVISFTSGLPLVADYRFFPNHKPLLLFMHGLGLHLHELEWFKNFCLQNHYSYLIYARTYSSAHCYEIKKKSDYNLAAEIDDCKQILFTLHHYQPKKKIIAIGHSLGAGILAKVLLEKKIQVLPITFTLINLPSLSSKKALSGIFFSKSTLVKIIFKYFFFPYKLINLENYLRSKNFPVFICCWAGCSNHSYQKLINYIHIWNQHPQKILFYMKKNNFSFKNQPLIFFLHLLFFWEKIIDNIFLNKKNKIIFFQGDNDDVFYDQKRLKKITTKWNQQPNLQLVYLKNFSHRFSFDDSENQKYFADQILPHLLSSTS